MKHRVAGLVDVGMLALIGGAAIILRDTVWPFELKGFHPLTFGQYLASFKYTPSSPVDFPQNVLLFVPLGFGLASVLQSRNKTSSLLLTVLVGSVFSLSIESCQIFLPNRVANVADIFGNTLGSGAGWFVLRGWQLRDRALRSAGRIGVTYVAFFAIALLCSILLMTGTQPGGWDPTYPVVVGQEPNGDRWKGVVDGLVLVDRVLDESSIAKLLGGKLPQFAPGTFVCSLNTSQAWEDPAVTETGTECDLASRINRSGGFTVAMTVASRDLAQEGPVSILTISPDPNHRNLTIGQEVDQLALRWRSPLTGYNGSRPEILFPGVFTSSEPRRLVVTSNGMTARLFTPNHLNDATVILGPECGLWSFLRQSQYWPLRPQGSNFAARSILFSGLAFCPLGMLLAFLAKGRLLQPVCLLAVLAGVAVPGALLEALVWLHAGGPPRITMMAIHVGMTLLAFAVSYLTGQRTPIAVRS